MNASPPTLKLASKLLVVQIVFLAIALGSIGLTLYVSWKLEGSAAAINDAGSLRMRAWRLAYLAGDGRASAAAEIPANVADFETVLGTLRAGDPARPLALPRSQRVTGGLERLDEQWSTLSAQLLATARGAPPPARADVESFVATVNALVAAIEADIDATTSLLRAAQLTLVGLAIAGTVALMYLSFLLVIRPLTRLHEGIARMASGDLSARVAVESRDEFGQLTEGFNLMAARLEEAYRTLESRVEEKTRSLAERNARLGTLYDMAAFLTRAQPQQDLCDGFLDRVARAFGAEAAALRVRDAEGTLHLQATRGLDERFLTAGRCVRARACTCGEAATGAQTVVQVVGRTAAALPFCRQAGFAEVVAVPVEAQGEVLGVFNLFYRAERAVSADERHLLHTLGQHLGAALENARVASLEKEIAISEERNLLAQELHDSIAQSLAFLNLQAQMLQTAVRNGDAARVQGTAAEIREGVQECYGDVRELLTHFRTRLAPEDLQHALATLAAKFERRTGIATSFAASGAGVPLPPDRQLQALHVVQEALSNARKHARCTHVGITLELGPDCRITVRDDGRGFDLDAAAALDDHVGLRIMRERALRAGGRLEVRSHPGAGTEVSLTLPGAAERQAA